MNKTNTSALNENWHNITFFKKSEWKGNYAELEDLDFGVIQLADEIRNYIGTSMVPSPVSGAFSRYSGSTTSKHYAVGRLSTAGDFFVPNVDALDLLLRIARMHDLPMGLGIYLDTVYDGKPCIMIHIDLRSTRMNWIRDNGQYCYDTTEMAEKIKNAS